MAQTIVTDAKASTIKGSLLIFYVDGSHSLLLNFIGTLVPAELPVVPPSLLCFSCRFRIYWKTIQEKTKFALAESLSVNANNL